MKIHKINRVAKVLVSTLFIASIIVTNTAMAENIKVKMDTNKGSVIIELYPEKAPETVKNFLHYVNEGKYDSTVFHRVVKGFVNQGGGYNHNYKLVDTFEPVKNEADNGLKNLRGTIAMARKNDPDSARNQFFINTADNKILDHKDKTPTGWGYCVFGEVVEGMDVMDRVSRVKTRGFGPFAADAPLSPISIRSIVVIKGTSIN
ncbi:MAG: peptidyl-prolyl cis-trans isomerase [Gammaproteobacteria bacterium]|nr:MAG: peptidyl-prolyl cis-trans isomerase [Gammaproteobacteria bacterium]